MGNELKHFAEFKSVLSNYQISTEVKKTLDQIKLVVLTGPTASGRNTIIDELVKKYDYYFLVSDTTRKPRINDGVMEENGQRYWFRSEEEVLEDLKRGKLLSPAIIHEQQVSGKNISKLKNASEAKRVVVTEIEIQGVIDLHRISTSPLCIFVLPPSFEEWLSRIQRRGQLPEDEVGRRLTSAVSEIESALANDFLFFIVNDNLAEAVSAVARISTTRKINEVDQNRAKTLAQQLVEEIHTKLTV